jgi:hypothetical protein
MSTPCPAVGATTQDSRAFQNKRSLRKLSSLQNRGKLARETCMQLPNVTAAYYEQFGDP